MVAPMNKLMDDEWGNPPPIKTNLTGDLERAFNYGWKTAMQEMRAENERLRRLLETAGGWLGVSATVNHADLCNEIDKALSYKHTLSPRPKEGTGQLCFHKDTLINGVCTVCGFHTKTTDKT